MNNISKGEALISLVSQETSVYAGQLMENKEFVSEAKEALRKSSHKLPTPCNIVVNQE